jgi:putative ABC transport system permease protein
MQRLLQDLGFSARMLLKRPGFTLIIVITLALGIGANTAIFSVVDAVLLRPLPFPEPDRLMVVWNTAPQYGYSQFPIAYGTYIDISEQSQVFEQMGAWNIFDNNLNLSGGDEPEQIPGAHVTSSLFTVLGVKPILGRTFLPEDDKADGPPVVVISEALWKQRFGSDPSLISKQLKLDTKSYTVIGIMPAGFTFPATGKAPKVWLLISQAGFIWAQRDNRGSHDFGIIARLKQGVSASQARVEMDTIAKRLEQAYPQANTNIGIQAVPLHKQAVREIDQSLLILFGAVAFVLLIACTNVANILLARASSRQKEIALRAVLGASRWRLIRLLLTESVLLSVMGGVLGVLIALWGIEVIAAVPSGKPEPYTPYAIPLEYIGLNGQVLGFTFALSLLVGIIFGLIPALQASRIDLNQSLKEGSQRVTERSGRTRSALVVCQIALSLVLLIGAGLMIKSFLRLQQVDPGFQTENVLTAKIILPQSKYHRPSIQRQFYEEVLRRIEALPGVVAAGITRGLPFGEDDNSWFIQIEGQPPPPSGLKNISKFHHVSANYFRAMGIELLDGRLFNEGDTYDGKLVGVVNETFARRFLAGENPIGKRINGGGRGWVEIVGMVKDAKFTALHEEPVPEMYATYFQYFTPWMNIVVRTASDPKNLAGAIRNEVLAVDRDQPIADIQMMGDRISSSVARPRYNATLLSLFALLALILAAVGIYGVISYSVAQRTHEIGIRIALGAQRRDVLKLVVGQGMLLALIGVATGLGAAFALTRVMSTLLFGVSATDATTFVSITLLLTAVALLACWIPARRATRVDPMVALRYE